MKTKNLFQLFSRIATHPKMMSIKVIKLIFIMLGLAIEPSIVYADVYKCVVNGKTVYSDTRCAYKPDTIKTDPNQNVVQGARTAVDNGSQPNLTAKSKDPKCAELLDQISNVRTIGKLNAITQEYELRCMSPTDRQASVQNRNNQEMQRKLNDIQRTQQEIQNRQRGIGY
jgi:hypothetical protein